MTDRLTADEWCALGAADERGAVVAYLRAWAARVRGSGDAPSSVLLVASTLDEAAADIRDGAHRKGT